MRTAGAYHGEGMVDEDFVQHVALAVARATAQGANVEASVANAVTDWFRNMKTERKRARRTKSIETLRTEPSVPSFVEHLEAIDMAQQIMDLLPPEDAKLLAMRYLEECTIREVADAIDRSTTCAKRALERASERARRKFEEAKFAQVYERFRRERIARELAAREAVLHRSVVPPT